MAFLAYPSALVLLAANGLPLWFVLHGDWNAFPLLLAYWWEGVIIGVLAILKVEVIRAQASRRVRDEFDANDAPPITFGLIVALLAFVDLWLIGTLAVGYDGTISSLGSIFVWRPGEIFHWLTGHLIYGSVLLFAIIVLGSHAYSWYNNFIIRREFTQMQMLLDRSMVRIVVPQLLAVILALVSLSVSFIPLWSVVVAKTLADVLIHLVERMTANPGPGGSNANSIT